MFVTAGWGDRHVQTALVLVYGEPAHCWGSVDRYVPVLDLNTTQGYGQLAFLDGQCKVLACGLDRTHEVVVIGGGTPVVYRVSVGVRIPHRQILTVRSDCGGAEGPGDRVALVCILREPGDVVAHHVVCVVVNETCACRDAGIRRFQVHR